MLILSLWAHFQNVWFIKLWAHKLWTLWSRYICECYWGTHFAIMNSQIKTKVYFVSYLEWIPTSLSIQRYFGEHSKIFALGMIIYNCLLQQVSHFEFGLDFELVLLWRHNRLETRVMHVSLNHNVTWVNMGWIIFCSAIKQILQA